MKTKRRKAVLLMVLLAVTLFGGCGKQDDADSIERYPQGSYLSALLTSGEPARSLERWQAAYYLKTDQFLLAAESYYALIVTADEQETESGLTEDYYLACAQSYLQAGQRENALEIYREAAAALPHRKLFSSRAEDLEALLQPEIPPAKLADTPTETGAFPLQEYGAATTVQLIFSGAVPHDNSLLIQTAQSFEEETGHTLRWKQEKGPLTLETAEWEQVDLIFLQSSEELEKLTEAGLLVPLSALYEACPAWLPHYDPAKLEKLPPTILPTALSWQGLFVNRRVLDRCGVSLPQEGLYSWKQFAQVCKTIRDVGLYPIVVEQGQTPDRWTEWGIAAAPVVHWGEEQSFWQRWGEGVARLGELYQESCVTASNGEMSTAERQKLKQPQEGDADGHQAERVLLVGKTAFFLGDGESARYLQTQAKEEALADILVLPPPYLVEERPIGVCGDWTRGWAVTKSAWNQPEKRPILLSLLSYLTASDVLRQEGDLFSMLPTREEYRTGDSPFTRQLCRQFYPMLRQVYPLLWQQVPAALQQKGHQIFLEIAKENQSGQNAAILLEQYARQQHLTLPAICETQITEEQQE